MNIAAFLKNLTAPITVDYRGAKFALEVLTERFYDAELKAQVEASVPPLPPEPVAPAALEDGATDEARAAYAAERDAYAAALLKHAELARERVKDVDAAFMAAIITSWKVNGETIDGEDGQPLLITGANIRTFGDILISVIFQGITQAILHPLKPIN